MLSSIFEIYNMLLEEPFNPRENKERIIKMLNQKKMMAGLAECTVSLYKKYRDTLAKKN